MKVLRKLLVVFTTLLLAVSCTIEGGDVVEADKNKIITCTDTRDGEVFSFNTNSVTNVRQGFGAPHSMTIVTSDGESMIINSNMEAWLKCDKT